MTKEAKIIFALFVIVYLLVATAQAENFQKVYSIGLEINKNDTVTLEYLNLIEGILSDFPTKDTGYTIKILTPDGKELFSNNLGVAFVIIIDPLGLIPSETTSINVRVPYFLNARFIEIYHLDKRIFQIDLSEQICNNNSICEAERGENRYVCPKDCEYVKPETKTSIYLYLIFIVAIFLVIFILIYKTKVK
jgi:hypothetical protein